MLIYAPAEDGSQQIVLYALKAESPLMRRKRYYNVLFLYLQLVNMAGFTTLFFFYQTAYPLVFLIAANAGGLNSIQNAIYLLIDDYEQRIYTRYFYWLIETFVYLTLATIIAALVLEFLDVFPGYPNLGIMVCLPLIIPLGQATTFRDYADLVRRLL